MKRKHVVRRWLGITLLVLGIAWTSPLQAAKDLTTGLRARAEQLERSEQWDKACEIYEQMLAQDRNLPAVREHYLLCLRHSRQVGRHRDPTYQTQVVSLSLSRSLDLYEEVLAELRANHIDREKVKLTRLFREGLTELRLALHDQTFHAAYLSDVKGEAIRAFVNSLNEDWADRTVSSSRQARNLVREVAWAAHKALHIKPSVAVLEFACGACDVLDEYTTLLTPAQLNDFYASVDGTFVGTGIDVAVENQRLVIADIAPGSPATMSDPVLHGGDQILSIDHKAASGLTVEAAAELLKGDAGTTCELEIMSPGDMAPRTVRLVRQAVSVPSVVSIMLDREAEIGYIRITVFQKSTVQELDEAIGRLRMDGVKVLILDLRGNSGGLFDVAVQVAERFLSQGIIVSTQSQVPAFNKIHAAHNMNALTLPLVVLVDGDTASAAEIVAGALKENQRCKVVGQTTYGKGTSQRVFKLETAPAGIRVTLAKFFSPNGQAYSGRGVTPDIMIERTSMDLVMMDLRQQPQVRMAMQVARGMWKDEP